ncbi:MAG TPA: hypothetical protein VGL72_12520 [Bryobacteraceae bacterium]
MKIWDVETGKMRFQLPERGTMIRGADGGISGAVSVGTSMPKSLAFSPDSATLLVGEYAHGAAIWDIGKGAFVRRLQNRAPRISSLSLSADGQQLLVSGPQIWDFKTGAVSLQSPGETLPAALSPDFSLDARKMAIAMDDQIVLFDSSGYKMPPDFQEAKTSESGPVGAHEKNHTIRSLVYSPTGRRLLTTGGGIEEDRSILIWDTTTGEITAQLRHAATDDRSSAVAVFSPDGNEVLSAGSDRVIRLWDAATGKELKKFEPYDYAPRKDWAQVWSHWDTEARTETEAIAFSPDGKLIFTAGRRGVRIWNKANGKEIRRIEEEGSETEVIAISPNGRVFATGAGDGKVRWWEIASGRKVFESTGHAAPIAAPLRANIDETVVPVVITEQGENRNQCEEQRYFLGFSHGFACR